MANQKRVPARKTGAKKTTAARAKPPATKSARAHKLAARRKAGAKLVAREKTAATRTQHCTVCNKNGHNARTCANNPRLKYPAARRRDASQKR